MTLSEDVNLEEFVTAKDELSGADIKVGLFTDILSHVIINLFEEVMVEKILVRLFTQFQFPKISSLQFIYLFLNFSLLLSVISASSFSTLNFVSVISLLCSSLVAK